MYVSISCCFCLGSFFEVGEIFFCFVENIFHILDQAFFSFLSLFGLFMVSQISQCFVPGFLDLTFSLTLTSFLSSTLPWTPESLASMSGPVGRAYSGVFDWLPELFISGFISLWVFFSDSTFMSWAGFNLHPTAGFHDFIKRFVCVVLRVLVLGLYHIRISQVYFRKGTGLCWRHVSVVSVCMSALAYCICSMPEGL